jgi:uncharacterized protein (DUF58 family)
MQVFDSGFLQKLESLYLVARRTHYGQMLAQRTTQQRGAGLEFADHQEYTSGDDFRYLDWNVFARHGELLLKRFHEERDLRVDLLLDASRSMAIGEPLSKFDYARQVAAALAFVALAEMDRIACTVFADKVLAQFPVTRGKAQLLSLMRFLEELQTVGVDTQLDVAARTIAQRQGTRGVAIVISDFFDPHGFQPALDRLRHHQYEVFLLQVFDPTEADPPMLGDWELVDIETGQPRKVTIRPRDRQRYRDAFAKYLASLQRYARQHGLAYLGTDTHVPYDELMLRMMRQADWMRG